MTNEVMMLSSNKRQTTKSNKHVQKEKNHIILFRTPTETMAHLLRFG